MRLFPYVNVHVCFCTFRNRLLTEGEKVGDRFIACVRVRVEQVFGYMTRFMADVSCRGHGLGCVGWDVVSEILAYNLRRYVFFVG